MPRHLPATSRFRPPVIPRLSSISGNHSRPVFTPRIDVTGDGKTVLKGGWGRFTHMRHLAPEVDQANPIVSGTCDLPLARSRTGTASTTSVKSISIRTASTSSRSRSPPPARRTPTNSSRSRTNSPRRLERELFANFRRPDDRRLFAEHAQLSGVQRASTARRCTTSRSPGSTPGRTRRVRHQRRSGDVDHVLRVRPLARGTTVRAVDVDQRSEGRPDVQERRVRGVQADVATDGSSRRRTRPRRRTSR